MKGSILLNFFVLFFFSFNSYAQPTIEELKKRDYLDDYYSNVVLGHNIVKDTKKFASRYTGNDLNCTSCHLKAGTKKDAIPLNVAGMYPKWRDKNGKRNGIGLRIRECFVYSQNGIMPPEDSPEVMALSAYISFLSEGEIIGEKPEGRGIPILEDTGFAPNPANGKVVYEKQCLSCHQKSGEGNDYFPPLWGMNSYNKGAGMAKTEKAAGWIWANMPLGREKTLSAQDSKDVAAYINNQIRPSDPRESKLLKLIEDIISWFK
jgi:thiosulfate dehydrogenase